MTALVYYYYFKADIGRIHIKGYLYPIHYPKNDKKDMSLSLFGAGYIF
jgi:hypothetical protein